MLARLIEPALLLKEPTQRVVRGGESWVELQHLLITSDSFLVPLAIHGGLGQEGKEDQRVRLQLGRAAEPGQCLVPSLFLLKGPGEAEMSLGQAGVLAESPRRNML